MSSRVVDASICHYRMLPLVRRMVELGKGTNCEQCRIEGRSPHALSTPSAAI